MTPTHLPHPTPPDPGADREAGQAGGGGSCGTAPAGHGFADREVQMVREEIAEVEARIEEDTEALASLRMRLASAATYEPATPTDSKGGPDAE